ncbi:MAG: DegT/DnrJ/EryC1/StrS family aminotransferase [Alcanivorax sp.]|nr:DegT/DnrJ/EryC1/StrS family aminotransferase [Alcanivorax sp.]
MIPVTKPYLPDRKKLDRYIDGIYERNWLTNNGPLVQELTRRLEEYLGVENLLLVANGTLALQIAYRVLGVSGQASDTPAEAITTPFSFVATASSLKWEGVEPVFADIDPDTWCLDPANIEPAITSRTRAIVPVHVFGNACEVEAINEIARKHNLKVIYDGAHAFGVTYKGESLLKHGDAATLSFHATKLFHTVEGGAIVFKRKEDLEKAKLMINFGLSGPEQIDELGINAKMNEFQAAMGLCVLDEMAEHLKSRQGIWDRYKFGIEDVAQLQKRNVHCDNNYTYFPAAFESKHKVRDLINILGKLEIHPRRYFYPSLDLLNFSDTPAAFVVSRDLSKRILCFPMYSSMPEDISETIVFVVKEQQDG